MNNTPKTIRETIKRADTFIDTKTGVKTSDSQGLDFIQQEKEYIDEGGKGRGGTSRVQVGRCQYKTKKDGGGNADSSNKNSITTNGCYHCGNTDHILIFAQTLPRSR